jgi:hypothetical protein
VQPWISPHAGYRWGRALKCLNTIIVLRDDIAWSIEAWRRVNMLINVFTVFRVFPWVTDDLTRIRGLEITMTRVGRA